MTTLNTVQGECRTYSDLAHTHDHPFAQLILPLQGTLFIETTLHQFELDDSRLFFLPPQCQHTFFSQHTNRFLILDIPSFLLMGHENHAIPGGLSLPLDDRWHALRSLLLAELHASPTQQDFISLFHYAYRLLQRDYTPRSVQYMQTHYQEAIATQTLAELEGYTVTYYCEWFKQLTGQTPKQYLQTLRLTQAKTLLEQTDLSILQIAQQVGYEHHSSLTRLFQQVDGMTPAHYRHTIRNQAKHDPKVG